MPYVAVHAAGPFQVQLGPACGAAVAAGWPETTSAAVASEGEGGAGEESLHAPDARSRASDERPTTAGYASTDRLTPGRRPIT